MSLLRSVAPLRKSMLNINDTISIIVTWTNNTSVFRKCLTALASQDFEPIHEIIVLQRIDAQPPILPEVNLSKVTFVRVGAETTIPMMKYQGARSAKGNLVLFVEDHCIVPTDWAARLANALNSGFDAAATRLENIANSRIVHRAAFVMEYAAFAVRKETRESWILPGNCIGYQRNSLLSFWTNESTVGWEYLLHQRMIEAGRKGLYLGDISVQHELLISTCEFLKQKFHFARSLSAERLLAGSPLRRILHACGCSILPFIFLGRLFRNCFFDESMRRNFVASFPLLVIFSMGAAAGEAIGSLAGSGKSAAKVT